MRPKVSVIVPVYNVKQYLRECLESLASQTIDSLEIVCVNDGSTDGSLCVLEDFASDHPNMVIIDKENAGYGAAMNDGVDAATGEYFGIVEPDDYVLDNMFERLYQIAKDNNLDLIKSDHYEFRGKGIDDQSSYVPLTRDQSYYGHVINPSKDPTVFNLNMVTCSGIYNLDYVKSNGIRYNETPGASYQDNGFWHQSFYFANRVMFLDEAFYCYRQDNVASSTNSKGKSFAGRNEYRYIYDILKAHPDKYEVFIGMHTFRKFNNYMYNYQRIEDSSKREFLEIFSQDFREFDNRGEIDWGLFDPHQSAELKQIMHDPTMYYAKDFGLPVVFATDDAYAPYAGVAIQSLKENADPSNLYAIYVLYTSLSAENMERLLSMAKGNVGVSLINVSKLIGQWNTYSTAHYSKAMFYRILIPRLFSKREKVLYLDSDILIFDDIAKLFDMELGSCAVGAVRNICTVYRSQYVESVLGLDENKYFNSGVLMFNVKAYIDGCVEERCVDLMRVFRNLECPDQDILNLACSGKVFWVPGRWNVAWQHAINKDQHYVDSDVICGFEADLENVAILHFTSASKPWNEEHAPFTALFWDVAERSPFDKATIRQIQKEKTNKALKTSKNARKNQKNPLQRAARYYRKHGVKATLKRIAGIK